VLVARGLLAHRRGRLDAGVELLQAATLRYAAADCADEVVRDAAVRRLGPSGNSDASSGVDSGRAKDRAECARLLTEWRQDLAREQAQAARAPASASASFSSEPAPGRSSASGSGLKRRTGSPATATVEATGSSSGASGASGVSEASDGGDCGQDGPHRRGARESSFLTLARLLHGRYGLGYMLMLSTVLALVLFVGLGALLPRRAAPSLPLEGYAGGRSAVGTSGGL